MSPVGSKQVFQPTSYELETRLWISLSINELSIHKWQTPASGNFHNASQIIVISEGSHLTSLLVYGIIME